MTDPPRIRRSHNELKYAIRDFLAAKGGTASIAEITEGVKDRVGTAPASSYRSTLQDTGVFERVSRGVFRLAPGTDRS